MSLQPHGEELRKAVKWISEQRTENPSKSLDRLVEEASVRHNLSPKEEAFLLRFVREELE